MKKCYLLLAFVAFASRCLADSVEIVPSGDATIYQAQTDRNFGMEAVLSFGRGPRNESRTLLRFDIAGNVHPGSVITNVSLILEPMETTAGEGEAAGTLHRMTHFWNEGRGTSAAVPPTDAHEATWGHRVHPRGRWIRPGGARGIDFVDRASASIAQPATGAVVVESNSRLVRDVQGWLDRPYTNEGWMLLASGREFVVASREDALRAPKLMVEFTPPALSADSASAEYEVTFRATWSAASHPRQFPANAHWSGLVGGVHNHLVSFWRRGATATEGIRRMAEIGNQGTLLGEVNVAIAEGTANRTLAGSGIATGSGRARLTFTVDRSHPLVTLTSMVAPSPDWFVGVRNVPLFERGRWVSRKAVPLFPYDAGTDSGETFLSADLVTQPRGVISRIATPPLANGRGVVRPMGTMTFRRIDNARRN